VFAAGVAVSGVLGFPLPGLAPGVPWGSAVFLAVLLGLWALALGAMLAALGGAMPGRESLAGRGRGLAGLGLGVGVGVSLVWCLSPGALETDVPLAATWMCLARAVGLAALPALVLCVTLARAYECRQRMGGVWAWLGAVALGATAVHASCSAGGAPHVVLGHVLEPLVLAALGGALIAPWLRRGPPAESAS
jgi:hypothetical protein